MSSETVLPAPENYDRRMKYYIMPVLYKTTSKIHENKMREMLSDFKDLRVLDIACGNGLCEKVLDSSNESTGLDISSEMLNKAKKTSNFTGIIFNPVRGDAMRLSFKDESFGLVVCSLGLHFLPDLREAIKEASRVLQKNGSFVCCCPVMESGIFVDFYWEYYYKKGRFNTPIFEKDLEEACISCGLSYSRFDKCGKLLYFSCKKI